MTEYSHRNYRVAEDARDDVRVSTVWVGPDRFETMVFGGDHDRYSRAYSTEESARAGHAQVCIVVLS